MGVTKKPSVIVFPRERRSLLRFFYLETRETSHRLNGEDMKATGGELFWVWIIWTFIGIAVVTFGSHNYLRVADHSLMSALLLVGIFIQFRDKKN